MAEETAVQDDLINQAASEAAEGGAEDKAQETEAATEAAPDTGAKETGTLLSDDEGDGSDDKSDVPEKYEFEPPEDFEVSEEVQRQLDQFGETAKELGLSQAQYQKLVEWDIQRARDAVDQAAAGYSERISQWADTVKADKELGGENLNQNLAVAKQAIDQFGSPELSKLIKAPSPDNPEGLGLGNHPELIRFMYRVGKALGEDNLVVGDTAGASSGDAETALRRMYPSMYKEAS